METSLNGKRMLCLGVLCTVPAARKLFPEAQCGVAHDYCKYEI